MVSLSEKKSVNPDDGVSTYYRIFNSEKEETLVIVSGLSQPDLTWDSFISLLSEKFCVISFDLRGVGFSQKPLQGYSMEIYAKDLAHLLNQEKRDQVFLLGYSYGGTISLAFSQIFPERVKGLILASTIWSGKDYIRSTAPEFDLVNSALPENPTREQLQARAEAFLSLVFSPDFLKNHKKEAVDYLALSSSRNYAETQKTLENRLNAIQGFTACLELISAPTLILHGLSDRYIPVENARYMAKRISRCRLEEIPASGHQLFAEQQEVCAEKILELILELTH